MKLKNILKTTALFILIMGFSLSSFADTPKMYGIQGDSLSIKTTIPTPQSYEVNGKTYTTQGDESKNYSKEGAASYYHNKFNGRKTANGERYDSSLFTAAHKTLPLNSYAVVTNLHNNRKVIVRINDRGPFSEKRIIDLSHSAAKELGLIARGTGHVRIEALHVDNQGQISGAGAKTLAKHAKTQEASDRLAINKNSEKKNQNSDSTSDAKTVFKLKLLALSSKNQAENIITKLALDDIKTEINQNGRNYEIHFGPISDQADINQLKTKLQKTINGQPVIVYTYKNQ